VRFGAHTGLPIRRRREARVRETIEVRAIALFGALLR